MEFCKLKDKSIRALLRIDGRHSDGAGLFLRVRNGSGSWALRATEKGKRREFGLGSYPAVSLKTARELAQGIRDRLAQGLTAFPEPEKAKPTLGECFSEFISAQADIRAWRRKDRRLLQSRGRMAAMGESLKDCPIDEITPRMIAEAIKPFWKEHNGSANLFLADLKTFFNQACALGIVQANPAQWQGGVGLFLPSASLVAQRKHLPALSVQALKTALPYWINSNSPRDRAIAFIAFTAMRLGETLGTKWDEFDSGINTLSVSWERVKTAKLSRENFRVPIPRQLRELLRQWKADLGSIDGSIYLFPKADGEALNVNADITRHFHSALKKAGIEESGTIHGIRSTFRDWAARQGVDFAVAEKCLNHRVGNAVTSAYLRDDLLEQRRAVMQAWADELIPKRH